jgi:hypothetical protein
MSTFLYVSPGASRFWVGVFARPGRTWRAPVLQVSREKPGQLSGD